MEFSPIIATQAIPLLLYWRVRQSIVPSVLSAVLMSAVLSWVYVGHPFAMLHPGPLLGLWYPFAAFFLILALVPGFVWAAIEKAGRRGGERGRSPGQDATGMDAPPRPDAH